MPRLAWTDAIPHSESSDNTPIPDPVSIAAVGKGKFAIAGYRALYTWRRGDAAPQIPTIFAPPTLLATPIAEHWNPAGVYYADRKLYVANYSFHDVLVFDPAEDFRSMRLSAVITETDMVSPENVFVEDDTVVVADYDASGIFVFDRAGHLKWKRLGLPLAHGVTIADGAIYVACLGERKLLKYDMNGNLLAENDAAGWRALLYPTSIAGLQSGPFGAGIAVIDANRGSISFYSAELRKLGDIGGNGPNGFNRPYGFVFDDGRFLVADTKNHRLVDLSLDGSIRPALKLRGEIKNIGTPPIWGNGNTYCSDNRVSPAVFSDQFDQFTGFDTICTLRNGSVYSQILLPYTQPHNRGLHHRPAPGIGFAWYGTIARDRTIYAIIGSPNSNIYMVFEGDDYVFVDGDPNINVWGAKGAEQYLGKIAMRAGERFKKQHGLAAVCSPLYAFLKGDEPFIHAPFDELLLEAVTYANAKDAVGAWLNGDGISVTPDQLLSKGRTAFEDLHLITLLAATDPAYERRVWRQCKE